MKYQVKGLIAGCGGRALEHLSVVRPWVLLSSDGSGRYCMRVIGTHAGQTQAGGNTAVIAALVPCRVGGAFPCARAGRKLLPWSWGGGYSRLRGKVSLCPIPIELRQSRLSLLFNLCCPACFR